jgi:Leucine-rich repeat (LRR) protein
LPQVRSLDLASSKTTDAGLEQLKTLTGLQCLNLSGTEITDAGLAHLKGLVQLQSLNLSQTNVKGAGLENLAGMTQLRELMLAGKGGEQYPPGPRPFDDAALRHLRALLNLKTLDLSRTSITDAGLAYVGRLKGLESLNLWNGGGAWRRRLSIPSAPYLDDITDVGLAHLRELQSLQSLDLSGRSITDVGVAHLKTLRGLRKLGLSGTLITWAGVESLRQVLPKATIDTDMVGEKAVAVVEGLGGKITRDKNRPNKPVIGLNLSKARISDANVETVANFPQLETLDLSETDVTDAGLVWLRGLRQLRELDLRHTKITDAAIKELQRALPKCNIRRWFEP